MNEPMETQVGVRLPRDYRDFLAKRQAETGATVAAQIRLMIAREIETADAA